MSRVALLLALCTCASAVLYQPADTDFLQKQKAVYELFWHVDQPSLYHVELYRRGMMYKLGRNLEQFEETGHAAVEELAKRMYHNELLPRGQFFSVFNPEHLEQVILFYHTLKAATTFETFMDVAAWARIHLNEPMYLYTLAIAVLHRPELKYVKVPPLYEVLPHLFFDEDTMHKAYRIAMGDVDMEKVHPVKKDTIFKKTVSGVDHYMIPSNYSSHFQYPEDNVDYKLSYFTEDIGLNSFYFYLAHDFPFWLSKQSLNLKNDIRGEYFFYSHKQLLVRYYLERLSHDLGEIEFIDLDKPLKHGFHLHMQYANGERVPNRADYAEIPMKYHHKVQTLKDLHDRISYAVDAGYVVDKFGSKKNIQTPGGLNELGNLVQGNEDSINKVLYGHLEALARQLVGFGLEKGPDYIPGALEIFSTSVRDPAFYSLYKNILQYYMKYKENSPVYTHSELEFHGVKIENVTVDKLLTYFDYFDSMLNNGLSIRNEVEAKSTLIKARQMRLNHKPFTYKIDVKSEKEVPAMVRIFLGPKYDVYGHQIDVQEHYDDFIELDQWIVDLKEGLNTIERSSHESIYVTPSEIPSDVFYKKVVSSLENPKQFKYQVPAYGFPDSLLLPKGKKEGMPYQLFVCLHEVKPDMKFEIESPVWGKTVVDGRPLGFPLDRPFGYQKLHLDNFLVKDVVIFHKEMEELNVTVP